ncbi:MAG TPA: NIPSNAP family protein [Terriglobia bacterium]|nr:NIPSNAP family protein [Terriglobia bacterium]
MKRRRFLASSLAASALAAEASSAYLQGAAVPSKPAGREYYELRRYEIRSGPQAKLADTYFQNALIPALNRLGITPVGAFNTVIGPEAPGIYVLLPCSTVETLVTARFQLDTDAAYQAAASDFLNAPAGQPAYIRMESELMLAFKGHPKLTLPPATASRGARMFEVRTYESPSDRDHARKVEMFNSGEFDIFLSAGFNPVFYGDKLSGPRMPNLTYMLSFDDLADRDKKWKAFGSSPAWKKLSTSQRYAFEEIVSNITNVILSPAAYSQI